MNMEEALILIEKRKEYDKNKKKKNEIYNELIIIFLIPHNISFMLIKIVIQ